MTDEPQAPADIIAAIAAAGCLHVVQAHVSEYEVVIIGWDDPRFVDGERVPARGRGLGTTVREALVVAAKAAGIAIN